MTDRPSVLVVDDKENMRHLITRILGDAYQVRTAEDGGRALSLIQTQPFDVVVTDIRMPGADGFEVLKAVKQHSPTTEVILMTAYASVPKAVEAIKEGAYDYLPKPFDPDEASLVVARALERKRLKEQAASLRRELEGIYSFQNIIGRSAPMRALYGLLERASELDITVLITGETGTGKELVARAIHHHGPRKDRPFIAVNCGALPSELIESELFGHARGAFTGAVETKAGLFEAASGGTIFLDEIGELPLSVQVKLNRTLQDKEVRRVGDAVARRIDARVITATHRDLKAEVTASRFREDLYYRLNVFPVHLPPLRERREDIPLLAMHFVQKAAKTYRQPVDGLEPDALRALTGYSWPGNVRQLENAIERAVAITTGSRVGADALPPEVTGGQQGALPADHLVKMPFREAVDLARDRASRDYLIALLREFGGNVTRAAERAGMERESLHRLLKRFGLRSDDFKESP
ncbi:MULTISPECIES: sigma-54-dependent transcriptional regulator [Myxococcus]|uniref:Fis family transcriptional regulator n=1 Tax=Myxococcus xanthus TaxID=34 RepID=A0AAE6KSP2_MYXXA|nr:MULTISPECIES: sigma-54 dependent transcriptional regulator [Myxococcus]QDE68498.1 Fis family transcriptional regulator [Myxococcus xanthus]QDE75775.1 Fis family transcriptional regulator [Myxococcus xanthus]QDE83103.1 Fis family transcriptional regulator [Myxococcus xanthus]QDE97344.1 Fis family transcriptional regulator [Myxococcus xanthus]QDF04913.1 Fis family transcriptional regulator [Myxococcus xanthus]